MITLYSYGTLGIVTKASVKIFKRGEEERLLPAGFPRIADQLAENRALQSSEKKPSLIVSSCPGCKENLKLGAKRAKIRIKVKDLTELVIKTL